MINLKVFKNDLFEVALKLENGEWIFDVEKVSRSLGFTQRQNKNGKIYESIRWETINSYLEKFFPNKVGKGDFIPEAAVYKLAFKASNEVAEKFQDWLAIEVLPIIRKTGGYVASEDLFIETYLPYVDENTKLIFKNTLGMVRKQNEIIALKEKEIEHKEEVIVGLVDEITLAEKRQVLNRVVRYKGANFQERWRELYKQFEMKYHIDLTKRLESYNRSAKPKIKNKVDYIDKVMNKVPELYDIACKLYENDVKELAQQIYELN